MLGGWRYGVWRYKDGGPTAPARILDHTSSWIALKREVALDRPAPSSFARVFGLFAPILSTPGFLSRPTITAPGRIISRNTVALQTLRLFVLGSTFSVFLCALLSFSAFSPHACTSK
ncbi:hypothetical protein SNOG_07414 [Parastagonospora nodorum SN15]|uniref:Uncharacterized protein n=1 Tax=Phaeosphaeria nodorum (strain SN15 / ATCC MYA-4574 / FGSC 10173) TaxID=321614 RepID=Q0ULF0_PHANO|nr:hypothetical protein SNOG_07414 [Parastagonospora nodorum SN15]EAT84880.1 hypothetical protein SNOG_07414 [Parastagonospora nodorum SN15]